MIYPVDSAVQRLNKRGQLYKVLLNLHIFPVLKKPKTVLSSIFSATKQLYIYLYW